ncbi:hypothetical protein [uncultured Methanoregula sp.]|uniref:hypothetical protein n=1 Tax=uncultured Methanoregula sp. TaxID=1005933 RepID=UPI002AAC04D0|nr:hypothetical protein [uncultured Methanoregula sp.]
MKNAHEPTYSFVILTLVLIAIDTIFAWFCSLFLSSGQSGVSWLYIAVAFMILFTLWFGAYGAIAAYVGTFIGSGLLSSGGLSNHPEVAVYWAIGGLLQVLIPLVALRSLDADLCLENLRDVNILVVFGVLINNVIGAAWFAWTLGLGNIITPDKIGSVFSTLLIGNIIVTILIVPLALRFLSPRIQRSRLFVKNFWD